MALNPRKVQILWAKCADVARNLRDDLKVRFSPRFEFSMVDEEPAGEIFNDQSRRALDSAGLVLLIAAEKDWKNAIYARGELNYILKQMSLGIRDENTLAYVQYQDFLPIDYETASRKILYFADGVKLSHEEARDIRKWLEAGQVYDDFGIELQRLSEHAFANTQWQHHFLDRLVGFGTSIWNLQIDGVGERQLPLWQELLPRLRMLKALHSIHACPGPVLTILATQFSQSHHEFLIHRDLAAVRKGLVERLDMHFASTPNFHAVVSLITRALLPLLDGLCDRLTEFAPATISDSVKQLSLHLKCISDGSKGKGKLSLTAGWYRDLKAAINLLTDDGGIFYNREDVCAWRRAGKLDRVTPLDSAQDLYQKCIYLSVLLIVFFDILRLQEEGGSEHGDEVALLVRMVGDDCVRFGQIGLVDPIVKHSNLFILWYIDACGGENL